MERRNTVTSMQYIAPKLYIRQRLQQKKSQSLRDILSKNTKEFCKNTSLSGLKYVVNEKFNRAERIFFALSFVAVVIAATYFIWNVFHKWKTTPFIYTINPELSFITDEPFAAVTICNMNQASKTKAQSYSIYSIEYAMLQLLCRRKVNVSIADTISISDWNNLDKFVLNISQTCQEMMLACTFAEESFNCSEFFETILTEEGLCCRFNMLHPRFLYNKKYADRLFNHSTTYGFEYIDWDLENGYPEKLPSKFIPQKAIGAGEDLGLTVILDVESDDYYCSSSNSIGFKIALHSPDETPNMREVGVLLPAGSETAIRIASERIESQQNLRSIDEKIRKCKFQNEQKLLYFKDYTQRNCLIECGFKLTLDSCGCVRYYSPKIFNNTKTCSIYADECLTKVRARYAANNSCSHCLPGCFDLSFFSDMFSTPLSHSGFEIENQIVKNISSDYVEKNIAIVHMFYRDRSYRCSKRTEYIRFTEFLSSVGGLMSLFLGFSIISIAEVFYYALIRPYRMAQQTKKGRSERIFSPKNRIRPKRLETNIYY